MKFTIELSATEVQGIKDYFKTLFDEKADKTYIKNYIQNIVSGTLNSPKEAVSDFIKKQS